LQSYILANYNSASPGQVPNQFSYPLTGNSSSIKPDAGNYAVSNMISQVTGKAIAQYPFAEPVINEAENLISNSGAAKSGQDWVNDNWSNVIKK
jgi:filamentous hemagglutinin